MRSILDTVLDQTDLTRSEIAKLGANDTNGLARAAVLSDYMVHRAEGPHAVVARITRDLRTALQDEDQTRAGVLLGALKQFLEDNPNAGQARPRGY